MNNPIDYVPLFALTLVVLLLYALQARRIRENSAAALATVMCLEAQFATLCKTVTAEMQQSAQSAWDAKVSAAQAELKLSSAEGIAQELTAMFETVEKAVAPAAEKITKHLSVLDLRTANLRSDMSAVLMRLNMKETRALTEAEKSDKAARRSERLAAAVLGQETEADRRDAAKTLGVANNPKRAQNPGIGVAPNPNPKRADKTAPDPSSPSAS